MSVHPVDVLLTVPHGGPDDDTNAPPVAEALHRLLEDARVHSHLILNGKPRAEMDMNRPVARRTPFRKALAESVKAGAGLLIDVHSFPGTTERFRGNSIFMLYTPGIQSTTFYEEYVQLLREGARELDLTHIRAAVGPAEYVDDVVIHAHELGQLPDRLMVAEHNNDADPRECARVHSYAIRKLLASRERLLRRLRPL